MRFDDIQVPEEWWQVDRTGAFHVHDSPREALVAGGTMLSTCRVGGKMVVIVLDQDVSDPTRAQLTAHRPIEVDAIVYAKIIPSDEHGLALIDIEVGYLGDIQISACAVAVAVAANSAGTFKIDPDRYAFHVAGRGVIEATLRFDWDTERWCAEASELVAQGSAAQERHG